MLPENVSVPCPGSRRRVSSSELLLLSLRCHRKPSLGKAELTVEPFSFGEERPKSTVIINSRFGMYLKASSTLQSQERQKTAMSRKRDLATPFYRICHSV